MIGLSPKGVTEAFTVFPVMLIIALILDIVGIVLVCFGLDDFFITDIIGFLTVGAWVLLRSGQESGKGIERKGAEETAAKEGEEAAAKTGGKTAAKEGAVATEKTAAKGTAKGTARAAGKGLGKAALKVATFTVAECIPYVGDVLLGWTIMVAWEFISDLKNFSLEEGD